MNLKTLLAMSICFVSFQLTMPGSSQLSQLQAQTVNSACGCGVQSCKGCLRGKLNPVNLGSRKKTCGCAKCAQQTVDSVVVSETVISQEYLPVRQVAGTAAACGCKKCRILPRPKASCPKCGDCDFCELKVERTTEERPCFKVKQEEVCVPSVWLPWKKNCPPPRSKVRVVNRLKKDSYKCPKCKYTWSVHEPPVPKTQQQVEEEMKKAQEKAEEAATEAQAQAEAKAKAEEPKVSPKAFDLDEVPRPPLEEGN